MGFLLRLRPRRLRWPIRTGGEKTFRTVVCSHPAFRNPVAHNEQSQRSQYLPRSWPAETLQPEPGTSSWTPSGDRTAENRPLWSLLHWTVIRHWIGNVLKVSKVKALILVLHYCMLCYWIIIFDALMFKQQFTVACSSSNFMNYLIILIWFMIWL